MSKRKTIQVNIITEQILSKMKIGNKWNSLNPVEFQAHPLATILPCKEKQRTSSSANLQLAREHMICAHIPRSGGFTPMVAYVGEMFQEHSVCKEI
jgi:hypothetical protein